MASTLIVEDGTGVTNANSYQSIADLATYAGIRGVTLPATDAARDLLMLKAMDYIEAQRERFKGCKTDPDQSLQWPRTDVWIDGSLKSSTYIPREWCYAQFNLALEAINYDLQPNILPTDRGPVIETQVGPLKKVYANTGSRSKVPAFAKPDAQLAVLYKNNGLFAIRA